MSGTDNWPDDYIVDADEFKAAHDDPEAAAFAERADAYVREHGRPQPGEKCPKCDRRVNHPRLPSSPTSEVDSFRVPPGEKDNSRAVEEVASEHAGISTSSKFWRWRYRVAVDAYVLQQQPGFLARAMDGDQ